MITTIEEVDSRSEIAKKQQKAENNFYISFTITILSIFIYCPLLRSIFGESKTLLFFIVAISTTLLLLLLLNARRYSDRSEKSVMGATFFVALGWQMVVFHTMINPNILNPMFAFVVIICAIGYNVCRIIE